jgi:nucleotide-binding universal stress UspA family protein
VISINHVLCAVDLSPASAHALRHARAWAWCYGATLRVLHVAPFPQALASATGQTVVLPTRPLEAIRTDVEQFIKTALTSDSLPDLQVVQGYAVDTIVEESGRRPRSLLFMGTHGATGLQRMLLGSVTEAVAHRCACPLLVVPPGETTGPVAALDLRRIICAIDFRPSSLAALRYALSLAMEGKARLDLLTVVEPFDLTSMSARIPTETGSVDARRTSLLAALRDHVPDDARRSCTIHEEALVGSPAKVLETYAVSAGADLIVMGSGDRRHLHALWLGSTTGRMLRASHCPVLIVPAPPRPTYAGATPLPKDQWDNELERISRQHQGGMATLAIFREDLGTRREAFELPLVGVTGDLRNRPETVSVMLGSANAARLTHVISEPQDIRIAEAGAGREIELFIVGRDGSTTLLSVTGHGT